MQLELTLKKCKTGINIVGSVSTKLNRDKGKSIFVKSVEVGLNQHYKYRDFQSNYKENFLEWWSNITLVRKPIIAAVNGYALGGGCEVSYHII